MIFCDGVAARPAGEFRAGVADRDPFDELAQPFRPLRVGTADQQPVLETAPQQRNAVEAVGERAFVEEQLRPRPRCAVAANGAKIHVEQLGHAALVR